MPGISRRKALVAVSMGGAIAAGISAGNVRADQPHMRAALAALTLADRELRDATADKGGHRAKAVQLVKDAIVLVERGIEYDRHH